MQGDDTMQVDLIAMGAGGPETLTAEAAQALGSDLSGSGYGTELHISLSGKNCSAYFSIDEGGALSEYLNGVSSVIPE